jgi:hypothetical protein
LSLLVFVYILLVSSILQWLASDFFIAVGKNSNNLVLLSVVGTAQAVKRPVSVSEFGLIPDWGRNLLPVTKYRQAPLFCRSNQWRDEEWTELSIPWPLLVCGSVLVT